MRRSENDASSQAASARWSSGSESGWPWKLPPLTMSVVLGEHERVVGDGVELALDRAGDVGERVGHRAEHLRRAAQRVRVLDAAAVGVALDDRAAAEERRAGAPPPRPGRAVRAASCSRGSNGTVEPLNASSDSATATIAASSSRCASWTASAPAAAIRCVPLMIARPSLGPSATGVRPARASASPPGSRSPSMVASPSPIRTRPRCASGARSPDEPTDPLLGTTGVTPRSSSASTSSTSSTRTPEWPRRSEDASSSSIPRTTSSGSGGAGADRVRAQQVDLQLRGVLGADADALQLPEAGRDAVDRGVRRQRVLDDRAAGGDPRAVVVVQRAGRRAVARDGFELLQRRHRRR